MRASGTTNRAHAAMAAPTSLRLRPEVDRMAVMLVSEVLASVRSAAGTVRSTAVGELRHLPTAIRRLRVDDRREVVHDHALVPLTRPWITGELLEAVSRFIRVEPRALQPRH